MMNLMFINIFNKSNDINFIKLMIELNSNILNLIIMKFINNYEELYRINSNIKNDFINFLNVYSAKRTHKLT